MDTVRRIELRGCVEKVQKVHPLMSKGAFPLLRKHGAGNMPRRFVEWEGMIAGKNVAWGMHMAQ